MRFRLLIAVSISIFLYPLLLLSTSQDEVEVEAATSVVEEATEENSLSPTTLTTITKTAPDNENAENTGIEVVARFNYCNIDFMRRRIGKLGSFRELDPPQATDCLFGRCHPNFYVGTAATSLPGLPSPSQLEEASKRKKSRLPSELNLVFRGHQCDTNCTQSAFKTGGISVRSNSDESLLIREYKVQTSEIYDADFTDVKVYCPLDTCEGVISAELYRTRIMLTKTKLASKGEPIIKLYVNANPFSTFTTTASEQSDIQKCEKIEFF